MPNGGAWCEWLAQCFHQGQDGLDGFSQRYFASLRHPIYLGRGGNLGASRNIPERVPETRNVSRAAPKPGTSPERVPEKPFFRMYWRICRFQKRLFPERVVPVLWVSGTCRSRFVRFRNVSFQICAFPERVGACRYCFGDFGHVWAKCVWLCAFC